MATPDPTFPLYGVRFHFDAGEGTEPESTTLMRPWLYKTDPGFTAVRADAERVWPTVNWRGEARVRRFSHVSIELRGCVPWALAWFAHQTFRAGRTDEELRDSFERWVQRWGQYQDHHPLPDGVPCLMGAEDRWRWKNPCACDVCVRDDLAVIAH